MSKKLIIPNRLKRVCTFLLMLVVILTLSSCDSSNRKSTGSLDLSAEYASSGNFSVNVGELYDSLRSTAASYVVDRAYQIVYAEEIEEIKKDPSIYKDKLEEAINKAIYGTSDADEIADLDSKTCNTKILTYIDTMYKNGYVITKDQILAKDYESLYPYYYLDVAKYLGARKKLADEFKTNDDGSIDFGTIDDKSYFTEKDIVNYYKNNYKNTGNVEALLIRFVSSTEASNILRLFGIKAYDGAWYQIKLEDERPTTKVAYDKYYDNYTVNPTGVNGDSSIEYIGNGKATILRIFVEIYNYIYTYRDKIVLDDFTIESYLEGKDENDPLKYYDFISEIIKKGNELKIANPDNTEYDDIVAKLKAYDEQVKAEDPNFETIVMSNEKLKKYSDSLASYVYSTLATQASEEGKTFTQYSASAKSYGDYYFLVFKIGQEADKELYTEETDDDDNTTYTFTNEELKLEILNKLFEEKLDDTYITTCFEDRLSNTKLYIYDSMVELQFMYANSSKLVNKYEKTKKKNNNLVAAVKYNKKTTNITVSEAYAYLEPLYGPEQALILLFNKYIKTTEYYTKLEKDYDSYVNTIETMLYYFTNNSYSSYGYPSTMGKYNFMLMYFGTANIKDAVHNSLMVSEAQSAYFVDFASKGYTGNSFYEALKVYADKTVDDYYSLTATGINVYTDKDEDGEKDIMDDTTKALANELIKKIIEKAKNSHSNYATAITNIISNYNDATRFTSENPTTLEYEWAKYRVAGLFIEQEDIGAVTNTTTDKNTEVQARLKELYPELVNSSYGFTSSYLDDANHIIETETGYTVLLVTTGSTATSAKYDNTEELYKDVTIVLNEKKETVSFDANSFDSIKASVDAVKVYVAEYLMLSDVYSLPEATITALDAYLLPLLQRYTSAASQNVQMLKALGTVDYKDTAAVNPANNEAFNNSYTRVSYLNKYIETLQNSADSYDSETYPNWWTNMYNGGSN